jgi:DNA-3-methyladenine glycosylase II
MRAQRDRYLEAPGRKNTFQVSPNPHASGCYNLRMRIICESPYDFRLSWRMFSEFSGQSASREGSMAIWWEDKPVSIFLKQTGRDPAVIELISDLIPRQTRRFQQLMRTVLNADLELEPFYRQLRKDKTLRPIVNSLIGLKPLRPPDIFQMLLIAVSEQQISMQAARVIRERLLSRFGTPAGKLVAFPRAQDIATLKVDALRSCGLSQRKSESLIELAVRMTSGEIDTASWEDMPDDELIELLRSFRGVGQWTAEYILVRGIGRIDVVPASDLGVRRVVGHYLGGGRELSEQDVRGILEPWTPWRGLTVFYLLAHYRMIHMGLDQAQ